MGLPLAPLPMKRSSRPRFVIRPIGVKDVPMLADHRTGMWRDIGGHPERDLSAHAAEYRKWARSLIRSGRLLGFVAQTPEGVVAGSGCLWLRDAQPRPAERTRVEPYILSLYTRPAYRGQGVASRIVRSMLAFCRERGYPRVTLHGSVYGRPVYSRLGFERTWEMRRFLDPALARLSARRRALEARLPMAEVRAPVR